MVALLGLIEDLSGERTATYNGTPSIVIRPKRSSEREVLDSPPAHSLLRSPSFEGGFQKERSRTIFPSSDGRLCIRAATMGSFINSLSRSATVIGMHYRSLA
eukprot:gb/GEZJ01004622.1/.p1 GENE.gb/GEZJ01004622.1/~~gb/GEZJ01004622.1/.p1  ORF type:complete len:102 (+),score=5.49 gb/GEZJ01004622.1/:312-617(+)